MSTVTNPSTQQNLADATLSLKAVRQYQKARRKYGTERVSQYFDNVQGDWLEQFEDSEAQPSSKTEARNLSKDICKEH